MSCSPETIVVRNIRRRRRATTIAYLRYVEKTTVAAVAGDTAPPLRCHPAHTAWTACALVILCLRKDCSTAGVLYTVRGIVWGWYRTVTRANNYDTWLLGCFCCVVCTTDGAAVDTRHRVVVHYAAFVLHCAGAVLLHSSGLHHTLLYASEPRSVLCGAVPFANKNAPQPACTAQTVGTRPVNLFTSAAD